ncbi:ABC transporter ATP-binding protein [Micromonospora sp. NPDC051300]|uniref:ABC transporter ATP-binding protein n=1 Tax=Micromonospora sp. NPDC051300 TaxID=3364286 RepID=UPI0037A6DDA1
MSELQLRGLVKRRGGRRVVDEVSLDVAAGELVAILGPSGSGKTTALRLICGLELLDAGSIELGGRDITRLPSRRRNLGLVFQEYGLYPGMSVWGNLAYGLQARGVPAGEVRRRVSGAADRLGLGDKLGLPPGELSGGEQQRVALGRVLVKDADAYLFDEPLSNLDPHLRLSARRHIRAMHREKGRPTVYVTHDQAEAFALADRVAVVNDGRVQQVGTPDQLLRSPANAFVAAFVGAPPWNLVAGTLAGDTVRIGDTWLALPPDCYRRPVAVPDGPVTVGILPSAMRLAGSDGRLAGSVERVDALLDETVLTVAVGGVGRVAVVAPGDAADGLVPREPVRLGVDPAGVRLFDRHTGWAVDDMGACR